MPGSGVVPGCVSAADPRRRRRRNRHKWRPRRISRDGQRTVTHGVFCRVWRHHRRARRRRLFAPQIRTVVLARTEIWLGSTSACRQFGRRTARTRRWRRPRFSRRPFHLAIPRAMP